MDKIIVLVIAAVALILVIRHFVKGKCDCISKNDAEKMNESSCGGCCGCGSSKEKK